MATPSNGEDDPQGWFLMSDSRLEKLLETGWEHGVTWAVLGLGDCNYVFVLIHSPCALSGPQLYPLDGAAG